MVACSDSMSLTPPLSVSSKQYGACLSLVSVGKARTGAQVTLQLRLLCDDGKGVFSLGDDLITASGHPSHVKY